MFGGISINAVTVSRSPAGTSNFCSTVRLRPAVCAGGGAICCATATPPMPSAAMAMMMDFLSIAFPPVIYAAIIRRTGRLSTGGRCTLAKDLDEAIDVRLVVIDMGADAQAAEARGDENVLGGELRHQPMRHAFWK